MSTLRHVRSLRGAFFVAVTTSIFSGVVRADNFANVSYDAKNDQLVVTMRYRGTNPNHAVTLRWGSCKELSDGGGHEIVAEVLDSQWKDAARQAFTRTTRFSLADLNCRPAILTLRTAPRFYYTLGLPARRTQKP